MGDKTGIQWSDATWNPVTGCTKVSQGCKHCYAEGVAERFWPTQYPQVPTPPHAAEPMRPRRFTDVQCHPDRLDQPLRWKRPRRIFVNSMSDLFHEDVPDDFIAEVFAVMALARQHTFQVLTKRPERMRAVVSAMRESEHGWITHNGENPSSYGGAGVVISAPYERGELTDERDELGRRIRERGTNVWPLPNVHLGVSVEDQATADERIPLLLDTPAALRFVSYEPALAGVDFRRLGRGGAAIDALGGDVTHVKSGDIYSCTPSVLDWIIVGGESGPNARPFDLAWARQTVAQCRAAGVPCFVKQLGAKPVDDVKGGPIGSTNAAIWRNVQLRKRKGDDPSEWSEDLRVQEFPEAVAA